MREDIWREDTRTDRAIELLRICAAKTDSDGAVIPSHRYSRNFKHVAEHLRDLVWDSQSETVTIDTSREPNGRVTTVTIEVTLSSGETWEQVGVVQSGEDSYDWHALAACRALLQYIRDDGEPMSPDEVISMLEERRTNALRAAKRESA